MPAGNVNFSIDVAFRSRVRYFLQKCFCGVTWRPKLRLQLHETRNPSLENRFRFHTALIVICFLSISSDRVDVAALYRISLMHRSELCNEWFSCSTLIIILQHSKIPISFTKVSRRRLKSDRLWARALEMLAKPQRSELRGRKQLQQPFIHSSLSFIHETASSASEGEREGETERREID